MEAAGARETFSRRRSRQFYYSSSCSGLIRASGYAEKFSQIDDLRASTDPLVEPEDDGVDARG